jgi:geranylgeranyl pyrophosphate synthase
MALSFIKSLSDTQVTLVPIAQYYFDGAGKAIRPVITMCLAKAINYHIDENSPYVYFFFLNLFILYSCESGLFF